MRRTSAYVFVGAFALCAAACSQNEETGTAAKKPVGQADMTTPARMDAEPPTVAAGAGSATPTPNTSAVGSAPGSGLPSSNLTDRAPATGTQADALGATNASTPDAVIGSTEADSSARLSQAAEPQTFEVKGVVTQWRPMILFTQPGDSVSFRQMIGHDSETMEGLYPVGATPWRSKLGEEGFTITLTEPGAYIYKCNPHSSSGMIGAIVVGETPPANLAALEASPLNKGMTARAIRKLKEALAERD